MPYITGDITEASADTGIQVILKRPAGGKIWIRRINAKSTKNVDFGRWYSWMYKDGHDHPREIPFNKIVPQIRQGAVLFEGKIEWPFNWDLYLAGKTQDTLSRTFYSLYFEIELPIKKGWIP